jgi:hypothetical protein
MRALFLICIGVLVGYTETPLRTTLSRLVAVRDLENKTHTWTIYLHVGWDVGARPLFINAQPDDLLVRIKNDTELKPIPQGTGRIAITSEHRIEMPIRLQAPIQPSAKIDLLKGSYTVLGSKRTLSFTFDPEKPTPQSEMQDGVTVRLDESKQNKTMWTVRVRLTYPDDTPDFESFESWLGNNELVLERKDGKGRFTPNGGYSIDESAGKSATLTYRFLKDKNLSFGNPADWRFVYRTPGKIEKMPVKFEFKDLPAP